MVWQLLSSRYLAGGASVAWKACLDCKSVPFQVSVPPAVRSVTSMHTAASWMICHGRPGYVLSVPPGGEALVEISI